MISMMAHIYFLPQDHILFDVQSLAMGLQHIILCYVIFFVDHIFQSYIIDAFDQE